MERPRVEDLFADNSEIALLLRSQFVDADVTNSGSQRLLSPALLRQIRSLPPDRGGRVPAIALTKVLVQAISRLAQWPQFS